MAGKHATGFVGELCSSGAVHRGQFSCKNLSTFEIFMVFKNFLTGLADMRKDLE